MSKTIDITTYVNHTYNQVLARFTGSVLSMSNIFEFVRLCMEISETHKELSGREKKTLVISICNKAFDDMLLSDTDKDSLKIFVNGVLDTLIDNFVDIDNGNLHINENCKKHFRQLFACCL